MKTEVAGDVAAITLAVFKEDAHGRKYADVLASSGKELAAGLSAMSSPAAQLRMEDAETHHDRPAIAGVLRDIEKVPAVREVLKRGDTRADRLKMALGTAVRLVMEQRGWKKTGHKSAVGVGEYFTRAERYER